MSASYVVAPAAERDIEAIGNHIAAANPSAAHRLVAEFYEAFARLADMPGMGHRRSDLTRKPVRFWPIRQRYLIIYRTKAGTVEIARVLDGHRDIAALLA